MKIFEADAKGSPNEVELMVNSMNELSVQESADDPKTFLKPWNQDDLWQKTGDYSIYEDMANDDQISISLQIKKDLVIGDGIEFVEMDEGQEEIVQDLYRMVEDDYEGDFIGGIEQMLDSYNVGFSLTEKIYKKRDDGSIAIKSIKTRHPNTWKIHTDEYGNVTKFVQELTKRGNVTILPTDGKLIHYVNQPKYQNPYGTSDLRVAYEAWFTKKQVIKYYAIFMESIATPKRVGRYPANAPAEFKNNLLGILQKFQAKTSMVIPVEAQVEFLESKSNGEAYSRALDYLNMMIGRCLFVPDLAGFAGSETTGGSFSLGKEQIAIQMKHLQKRKAILENILNRELFRLPLTYNYGLLDSYPRLQFKPISDTVALDYAKLWLEAVNGKSYKPSDNEINHFRNIIKFPEGEVERIEMPPIMEVPSIQNRPGLVPVEKKDMANKFVLIPPAVDYAKNSDLKAMQKYLEAVDLIVEKESKILIDQIYEDLFDQIAKKKILEKKSVEAIDSIKLKKLKDLKQLLNRTQKDVNKYGQTTARQEMLGRREFAEPILEDEFLRILDEENFAFVGDWEYTALKSTRIALVQAIKDGMPLSTVLEQSREWKDKSAEQIERYARTKTTEVFNKARMGFFNEIEHVAGYQYSAVMDKRTSVICQGLHGKIFKKENAPVPPLHFNAVLAGTKIQMNGNNKNIEDIKIGDLVMTHTGKLCQVYDVMSKFEDKEYFEIELENGKKIKITAEHPVLIEREGTLGWSRVDELTLADNVMCLEDVINE